MGIQVSQNYTLLLLIIYESLKQLNTVVKLVRHRFPPVIEPEKYLTAVLIIAVLLGDRKLNFSETESFFSLMKMDEATLAVL